MSIVQRLLFFIISAAAGFGWCHGINHPQDKPGLWLAMGIGFWFLSVTGIGDWMRGQ